LQTAYIERPMECGANGMKDDSRDPTNDWHAKSIVDLADQLGC
jgi:2-haloacid dehalogenase